MKPSPISVVTFDLDDTLWAVRPVLLKAEDIVFDWLEAFAPKLTNRFTAKSFMKWRWNIYANYPELSHQISQLRTIAVQLALEESGYSPYEAKTLADQAFEIFIEARHQIVPFETAIPMLEKLQQHYTLGVLTNGNADIFRLAMGQFFEFSFTAEQLNASKPLPEPFLAAQTHAAVSANEIVHVGDSIEHDVVGALDAGLHAIWFNPDNKEVPADVLTEKRKKFHQVRCLSDIPGVIESIDQSQSHINNKWSAS